MADATHSSAPTVIRGDLMIPRIKSVEPMADFKLLVDFDEGRRVIYDVADDIRDIEAFEGADGFCMLIHNRILSKTEGQDYTCCCFLLRKVL